MYVTSFTHRSHMLRAKHGFHVAVKTCNLTNLSIEASKLQFTQHLTSYHLAHFLLFLAVFSLPPFKDHLERAINITGHTSHHHLHSCLTMITFHILFLEYCDLYLLILSGNLQPVVSEAPKGSALAHSCTCYILINDLPGKIHDPMFTDESKLYYG